MSTFNRIVNGIPNRINIPNELEKLCNWVDANGYPISGYFELREDDGDSMKYWFGFNNLSDRFGIFGAGPDGSMYAFWIDDSGNQKIVHLGSEGDALYILAESFTDFLRLLAIGYDEIGFANLSMTVSEWNLEIEQNENDGFNPKFKKWVENEFHVRVPTKGSKIANKADDSFRLWVDKEIDKHSD